MNKFTFLLLLRLVMTNQTLNPWYSTKLLASLRSPAVPQSLVFYTAVGSGQKCCRLGHVGAGLQIYVHFAQLFCIQTAGLEIHDSIQGIAVVPILIIDNCLGNLPFSCAQKGTSSFSIFS
jgi:hypothetical protein